MRKFKQVTALLLCCIMTLPAESHENTATLSELFTPEQSDLPESRHSNPVIAALYYIADAVTTAGRIVELEPDLLEYQARLNDELSHFVPELPDKRPGHVAIIMDGNRRWATKNNYDDQSYGHCFGAARLIQIVRAAEKLEIPQLTVYAFSARNWQRTQHEVAVLMALVRSVLEYWLPDLAASNVRVHHLGSLERLDDSVIQSIKQVVAATEGNTGLILNIVFNYDASKEQVTACQAVCRESCLENNMSLITAAALAKNRYSGQLPGWNDPDLMIRTSGELRISGFIPNEISESELSFPKRLWPDFTPQDLNSAVLEYSLRERRLGQ